MTGVDKPRLLLPIFYVIIVLFVNCIGVQMLPADNTDTPLDANNVAPLFWSKSIVPTSYTCHKLLH